MQSVGIASPHLFLSNLAIINLLVIPVISTGNWREVFPKDATWLSWSNWEPCSSTCIPSSRVRKRVCDIPKYGGVQLCNANDNQDVETCSATDCTPVNGEWIPWTLWTSCSLSCGGGQEIRSRSCSDPAPAFGGLDCPGLEEEALACNTQPCPVDGLWSTWSVWSTCSDTCGNSGNQSRIRSCSNPAPAHGGLNCTGTNNAEIQSCTTPICIIDGNWSNWGDWTNCTATCGGGTSERQRECTNPPPLNGANCTGSGLESLACNASPCPVDGGWGNWGPWATACSKLCGNGTLNRTRTCTSPAPLHGGANCTGNSTEEQACYERPCIAIMSSSKGGGVEAALKVNSLADVGGITCADPGAIGDANLKSTRCEISQGAPVCCGGAKWSSGTDAYNTCWKYDSATNGWDLMSGINMIGKRYGGHMVELDDGRIWYTGGYLAGVYLDTSELIDPVAGSVSAGPTLQYGVYKQKTLKRPSDGLIFMATGKNQLAPGTYNHNTLMAYDFGTSQWTNYPDMVVGRLAPAFMMTRDEAKIVISGGKSSCGTTYCDEHSSEIFTFATNTWAPAAPLPDTSVQYSFANLEDTVFAMGNLDNHVYKYDIATDAWIQMTGVISNSVNFDSAIIYLGDTSLCG